MIHITLVIVAFNVTLVGLQSGASDLQTALSRLENWKRDYGRGDLDAAIDAIRSQALVGDKLMGGRLLGIMENASLPDVVRMEAVKVACEKADAEMADRLVAVGHSWFKKVRETETAPGSFSDPSSLTLYTLATYGAAHLQNVASMDGQRDILELLKLFVLHIAVSGPGRYDALERIAKSPTPIEARRAVALEIVASNPNSTGVDGVIRDLLDSTDLPRLRAMVRESPDADHFHFAAASVLGHLGDQEIIEDLESWRPKLRARSRSIEWYVKGYIWMINTQHPPSRLLDYIRSAEDVQASQSREWAIRRAVRLDVPKVDIREAILEHARHHKADRYGFKVVLAGTRKLGLELGILRPGDLADVKGYELPRSP